MYGFSQTEHETRVFIFQGVQKEPSGMKLVKNADISKHFASNTNLSKKNLKTSLLRELSFQKLLGLVKMREGGWFKLTP